MLKILINPAKFNILYNLIIKSLLFLSIISLIIGLIFVFFISPNDYQQGSMVKIMYIHVPSAWLSLLTFFIMTIYSVISLSFKISFGFIINRAVAPVGAIFTLICLVTGSLWGKPIWGTWWVWDARLTSMFILFIFYLLIIFFRYSFSNIEVGEKITAILIILGSINLPIIKFSVDWWNTLHQPASISKLSSPNIDSTMLWTLLIMTISFSLIGFLISLIRIKSEIFKRHKSILLN